jgi:hypothetical protein
MNFLKVLCFLTELKIFLAVNAITSWLIELIIPFEVPPVLLIKLAGWCNVDLGWLNIGQLQVPAGVPKTKH